MDEVETVIVAEDETLFRHFLCTTLREKLGFEVLAETGNGQEALDLCLKNEPDMAIIDIGMPGLSGEVVAEKVLKALPDTRVLMVSASSRYDILLQLLEKGIHGFIHKRESFEILVQAIEAVADGKLFVCAPLGPMNAPSNSDDERLLSKLSDREKQILVGIADGKTNKLLASELGISIKTVEAHRTQIARKLNIHDIAGLTLFAARMGLVSL